MSEQFRIEKGIPIPVNMKGRRRGQCKYPLLVMEVGDSFYAPGKKASVMAPYTRTVMKRSGKSWRFFVRKENDGVRVWRVS